MFRLPSRPHFLQPPLPTFSKRGGGGKTKMRGVNLRKGKLWGGGGKVNWGEGGGGRGEGGCKV